MRATELDRGVLTATPPTGESPLNGQRAGRGGSTGRSSRTPCLRPGS